MKIALLIVSLAVCSSAVAQHRFSTGYPTAPRPETAYERRLRLEEEERQRIEAERKERERKARIAEYERQKAALKPTFDKIDADIEKRHQLNAPKIKSAIVENRIKSAANGLASFQYELGMNYLHGTDGFETNKADAVKWLKRAAEQDHAAAKEVLKGLQQ
jgi:TPR repeat protein